MVNKENSVGELGKKINEYIPSITLLSAFFTSLMTASKFIEGKITLYKNSIFLDSFIFVNSSEIIANLFIAITTSIFYILAWIQTNKNKQLTQKKEKRKNCAYAILQLIAATTIINYDLILKYISTKNIIIVVIAIIISAATYYYTFKKITTENLVLDSVLLAISILCCASILPVVSSFFNSTTDIKLAKYKNELSQDFNKIIIYSDREKSILCNYDIQKQQPKNCNIYEIVDNTDIIIKNLSDEKN